jgi:hypothetical protein
VYNSFLVDLLILAKRVDPDLKRRIREQYPSLDKRDPAHLAFGTANLPIAELSELKLNIESSLPDKVLDAAVVKGITVRDLLDSKDDSKDDREGLRIGLLRLLFVLAAMARLDQLKSDDATLTTTLQLVTRIQGLASSVGVENLDDIEGKIRGEGDSTLRGLLKGLLELSVTASTSNAAGAEDEAADVPPALQKTLSQIQDSKIGSIAREIAEELDFSSIDATAPQNWLDFTNMSNPNSFLGNVVNKLGTKLSDKMRNGELNQEDLLADTMSLMQSMGMPGSSKSSGAAPNPGDMMASLMSSLQMLSGPLQQQQQQQQQQRNQGQKLQKQRLSGPSSTRQK